MTSQKAEALAKYTKAHEAGMMSGHWKPLTTYRINLVTEEGLPTFGTDSAFMEGLTKDMSEQLKAIFLDDALIAKQVDVTSQHVGFPTESRPLFVRACPLTPRPGVLESSPVHSKEELRETIVRIIDKMLSVDTADTTAYDHGLIDPFGCIIVQPFIDADASAVVAPKSYIIMGDTHDGITAGSATLRLALPHTGDFSTRRNLKELSIDPAHIELEFISQKNKGYDNRSDVRNSYAVNHDSYIVQLRGSSGHTPLVTPPAGVTINGSVPQGKVKVEVVHVVHNSGDEELARLEEMLRSNPPKGTVVSHIGTGASHLSHHAGQCRKYGVPYIVSEVEVGQSWKEVASGWVTTNMKLKAKPYNPFEFSDAFKQGLNVGLYCFARQHGWLSNHFHQFVGAPLIDPSNTAFFGGVFVGWLVNAGLSVSVGELRHSSGMRSEKHNYMTPLVVASIYGKEAQKQSGDILSSSRKHYYTAIENKPITLDSIIALLKWTSKKYYGGWSNGYGGSKYKKSVDNTLKLAQSIKRYMNKPTEKNMLDVIGEANLCENNMHNTGFFFNKFLSKTALDWGTDATRIELNPYEFFRVYYSAFDAYQFNEDTDFSPIDVTHILKYVENITEDDLRNRPIFARKDIPQEMKDVEDAIVHHDRFHGHGINADTTVDSFIPCGSSQCDMCKDMVFNNIQMDLPLYKIKSSATKLDLDFPTTSTVDEAQSNIMYAGVVILKQALRGKGTLNESFITKTLDMGKDIESKWNLMTPYHKQKSSEAFAHFYSLMFSSEYIDTFQQVTTLEEE
tara:strand:- start:5752 stop:8121 length:2370 start_codon:yes stop_codon:yes gene_type:complete